MIRVTCILLNNAVISVINQCIRLSVCSVSDRVLCLECFVFTDLLTMTSFFVVIVLRRVVSNFF